MNHTPLKPEDEIKAGDEFLMATGWNRWATGWNRCPESFFGYKPCDFLPARFRRPTPDQPQEATETPEKADDWLSSTIEVGLKPLVDFCKDQAAKLHAKTARADRLAVLVNRKTFGMDAAEQRAWDADAKDALASEGPTLALAEELKEVTKHHDEQTELWYKRNNEQIKERDAAQAEVTQLKEEHDKVLSILPECRLWAEYARLNAHRDSFQRIDKLIAVLTDLSTTPTEPAQE